MQGQPIIELNRGLATFRGELSADSYAMKSVELAMVTFGPANIVSDFRTPDHFEWPYLSPPMTRP
jgi:uncharacterized protein YegL